jgi:hypothetical protein
MQVERVGSLSPFGRAAHPLALFDNESGDFNDVSHGKRLPERIASLASFRYSECAPDIHRVPSRAVPHECDPLIYFH